ncbi:DUF3892 domain-containing protein [Pseudomonas putida]|uniref:DUF3892 domain-containing protein n=1 Tax=Pseudomonas putida TaxID=303 RepID=UPI0018AA61D7|nr:DUF3892 domain-containing protein [Pseudomonas putida]MBF8651271.1 DUF3892 domain-containing protein [Pseudomonas putida]MBF8654967.1 DUF3892 domain-containing protein [Pseudomonas putida]
MTDFCITGVRYDSTHQHIQFVQVSQDLPGGFGTMHIVPRGFVADLIRMKKATFSTWVLHGDGKLYKGADVHVIDDIYLTTDANRTRKDNLGSLPEV